MLKDDVSQEVKDKMQSLRGRITSYAFDRIRFEVIDSLASKTDPDHVSHVDPVTSRCLCVMRKAFRLPCRHKLEAYEGPIPLSAVNQRWHIIYHNGRGKIPYKY